MIETARRLVHVVDDDRGVRSALAVLLRTSGYAVESWESGDALLAALPGLAAGCILLDLRMPGRDGLEVLAALGKHSVALPVILLTGHGDVAAVVQAMKCGAIDFLQKPIQPQALLDAVGQAHDHLADTGRRARLTADARQALAALTPREHDILGRLARGDPHSIIAEDLGISPRTVEVHRANLIGKLQVRNLPEALRIAFAAGMALDTGAA